MHVERFGNGVRNFLGLHGWNGTLETFQPIAANLPIDVTLWAADLPGCGRSQRPRGMHVNNVIEELETLLLRLPHPVTLIGSCSGALLGLLLAQRQPARVGRLVMIDAFAFAPWYFRIFTSPAGAIAYYTAFANPVGRALANGSLRSKRAEATDLMVGFEQTDHGMNLAYLKMFEEIGATLKWDAVRTPIELFYGERTFAAVRESIAIFQERLSVERVECLRGAGHLPLLEATDQIASLLFAHEDSGDRLCSMHHQSANSAS